MKRNIEFFNLGNGISVCDTLHEKDGDYVKVAHISRERQVTYYMKRLSQEYKERIETFAKTANPRISQTQDGNVFIPSSL
jgi:hypothetical protein